MKFFNKKRIAIIAVVLAVCAGAAFVIYQSGYASSGNIDDYLPSSVLDIAPERAVAVSDTLLSGKLVVGYYFKDGPDYDIHNIDWDIQATDSPNTFSLQLHMLKPAYFLSAAYLQTGDLKYLDAADAFVNSWAAYDASEGTKNRYTWYDHSTALRAENLIYYTMVSEQARGRKLSEARKLIDKHAKWLSQEKNYYKRHNHGIFEDNALVRCGYFLKNQAYTDTALKRLDEQLTYAFPNKYVHIENSTTYHIGIMSNLNFIYNFLHTMDNPYADTIREYYTGACEFLVYAYEPNLRLPSIGDSYPSQAKRGQLSIPTELSAALQYVANQGTSGTPPEQTTRFFREDGYVFFRESFAPEDYAQSSWLMFKSGFNSKTHKHYDDLSFMLYSKGRDIFIDPGMYNYMTGSAVSDYFRSVSAHNAVMVDGQNYTIGGDSGSRAGITDYRQENGYQYARGFNVLYPGVSLDRSVYWLDANTFLIADDMSSAQTHTYSQMFHLAPDVIASDISADGALLKIADSGWYAVLRQILPADDVETISGIQQDGQMSVTSGGLNTYNETTTLKFNRMGDDQKFVTLIQLVPEAELTAAQGETPSLDGGTFRLGDWAIDLPAPAHPMIVDTTAEITGSSVTLTHAAPPAGAPAMNYCYYLLDAETAEPLLKGEYSTEPSASFALEPGKSYAVKSYARTESKETYSEISGFLEPNGDSFTFTPKQAGERAPYVVGRSAENTGGKAYQFSLDTAGFNEITVQWYVYRNGVSYESSMGGEIFSYTFNEPGAYTIIYKVRDRYLNEIVHDNFAEIEIK